MRRDGHDLAEASRLIVADRGGCFKSAKRFAWIGGKTSKRIATDSLYANNESGESLQTRGAFDSTIQECRRQQPHVSGGHFTKA